MAKGAAGGSKVAAKTADTKKAAKAASGKGAAGKGAAGKSEEPKAAKAKAAKAPSAKGKSAASAAKPAGRYAIVTGAGSGVGKATALALVRDGWTVALVGRRKEPLEAVAKEAGPGKAIAVTGDVADPASVKAIFAAVKKAFGRLDFIFNNAGVGAPAVPLEDLTYEQWKTVVDINLSGVFLCTQEAFRIMKAQTPRGGRIVNNGSISAHVPRPNSAPYTATKHAVTGLTRSTSLDGRAYDIACGQVDIGNAATEMAARMAKGVLQANGQIAVEPLMDVEDVARTVALMASMPLASNVQFVTVMATKAPYIGRG